MNVSQDMEVTHLVEMIIEDSSKYNELGGRLDRIDENKRSDLINLLRQENPPLLGTGGTS